MVFTNKAIESKYVKDLKATHFITGMMETFHSNLIETAVTNVSNSLVVRKWLAWLIVYSIKLIKWEKNQIDVNIYEDGCYIVT